MAAILGYGAVTSLGRGVGRVWSAMAEGFDGIAPVQRFDVSMFGVQLGALVPDRNSPEHGGSTLCIEMSVAAAREALAGAQLGDTPAERIALVFGTSLGDDGVRVHAIAAAVGDALGIGGPRVAVSTACSSSTNAIGMALDLLALDAADIVIAGGADVLTPLVFAGFSALGVLSTEKCAPFSEPPGTTLGEGAGFLVLARDGARADALAVLGYGLSTDAFHDTGPDPTGAGVARGLRGALAHAGIAPDEVDYINAHGTGTRANDPAEWRAIQLVFGAHARSIPISASKSFLGHAQGAAGVLETIATLAALERCALPPTQQFKGARPNTPPDVIGQPTARRARCDVAVKASAAFGGANCSLVLARGRSAPAVTRRRVWLAGHAVVGRTAQLPASIDPRGMDPSTRYLTAAVSLGLDQAGLRMRGDARDRTGIVVGVIAASQESDTALDQTIERHGYRGLSANLFARQVVNAAAGTCARLLGVRGLHSVISAGEASGLAACIYAAELLAARRDADTLVAAAVDEFDAASDGAACMVLSATPGDVRIAAWQFAGPGRVDEAARRALATAQLAAADVVLGEPAAAADVALAGAAAAAVPSLLGVLRAVQLIRDEGARSVLVTQSTPGCADCALVIVGERHES